jgi:hypothetical protein
LACNSDGDLEGGWQAIRDTVGDTVVVRTVSGSVWGGVARLVPEMTIGVLDGAEEYMFGRVLGLGEGPSGDVYVVDAQVPALRVYSPEGVYQATIGRQGEGPGEYAQPDGLAVLSDGRLVLRDPRLGRLTVYAPDGTLLDTWPARAGTFLGNPIHSDAADNVWVPVLMEEGLSESGFVLGLARLGRDGTVRDTVTEPFSGYEPPTLVARSEVGMSVTQLPFSPRAIWTVSPEGYFVAGVSTSYTFTLDRPGSPLRIERVVDPVPVAPDEGRLARARVTASLRRTAPGWTWDGPDVPPHKPAYRALHVGNDGRIWVLTTEEGVELPNEDYDPEDSGSFPTRWEEDVAFDVFEPDGRYLGRVETPEGFSLYPYPVFGTDYVLAVMNDALDVQRVVRFRIERSPAS